jgi:hypothetical protein
VKRDEVLAQILVVRRRLDPALRIKLAWLGEYVGVHVHEILSYDHGSLWKLRLVNGAYTMSGMGYG